MKKNYSNNFNFSVFILILLFVGLNIGNVFSQEKEKCGFDHIYNEKRKDPKFKNELESHNLMMADYIKNHPSNLKSVLKIPIVVHVLHKGEAIGVGTNISDAQIQSSIANLNDVYANTINGGVSVNMGVQFELAKRDPLCNSTTGIVRINARTVPGYLDYGVKLETSTGADENTLKDLSKWPTDQYMNFWIVSEIDDNNGGAGVQGYANLPVGIDEYNGSVMMASVFGYDPTGTSNFYSGTNDNSTVTHEVGHFLDLYHPFEGDNGNTGSCPAPETNCANDGDKVCDTPPIMNQLNNSNIYFDCVTTHPNTCSTGNLNTIIHNIMNYTSCPDRFTAGQATRVAASLATSRASLTTSLGLTPPSGVFTAPRSACASITVGQGLTGGFGGITEVSFSNMTKVSSSTDVDNSTNGYMNYSTSCLYVANLVAGQVYPLKVKTYFNTQKVKAWIDYNNNGVFTDAGEEITPTGGLTSTSGAQVTQNVTIPASPTLNTSLRMRVISDIGSVSGSCHTSTYGQTEDYTVMITSNAAVASVAIASNATNNSICAGASITFTATPTNGGAAPTYQWSNNGTPISGATSSTYTTTTLITGASITCVMTSNLSGVTSSPATSIPIITTVITTSAPTGTASQNSCSASTVANLTATGTALEWYSGPNEVSSLLSSAALTSGSIYYASQTLFGCESTERFAVTFTINQTATPTGSANQTFCLASTVANLTATGTALKWYSTSTLGTALLSSASITSGVTYYVSQTLNGCESPARFAVNVTIGASPAPTGLATQNFCNSETIASLVVTGTGIKWYSASTGGSALATSIVLATGNYYGSQTIGGCESISRLLVAVTSGPTASPTGIASQSLCSLGTISNLSATGTSIQWYDASSAGNLLVGSTPLVDGSSYFASQTISGCESPTRLAVSFTIGATTSPSGTANQSFCSASTVASLIVTGTSIQWYDASSAGNLLAGSTPLVNGSIYYASQTILACESPTRFAVTVAIGSTPVPTGLATQSFCSASTVSNLAATGTAIQWYTFPSGGLPLLSSVSLINGSFYYASQTVGGCESPTRLEVTVLIGSTSAPTGTASQSFCTASTVSNLTATGTSIQWYTFPSGGLPLLSSVSLINGSFYYASQTVGGCESPTRLEVTVSIGSTSAPTGTAIQTFCSASTVSNLTATGTSIKWYTFPTGGLPLLSSVSLINGSFYYASQSVGGCESPNRLEVTVSIGSTSAPTGAASQSFCSVSTVSNLTATGTAIKWYSVQTSGTALLSSATLTSGTTYYASQTVGACESTTRLAVTVTIGATSAPTGAASQSFCSASTVSNLSATGTSIQWYSLPSGGSPLLSTASLTSGTTYYATQTVGACESTTRLAVTVVLGSIPVAPTTSSPSQNFCSPTIISALTVTGTNIRWYVSPVGGIALANNFQISNGSTYYASQSNGSCESTSRVAVSVVINIVPTVSISNLPTICTFDSPIALTQGSPVGGVYSGNGISNNHFNPSGLPLGLSTVSYTYTNVNLCSATAQTTILIDDCVGIDEIKESEFKIFPNPSNGNFTIISHLERINKVIVSDNAGRILMNNNLLSFEKTLDLDLSSYSDGIYIIQVGTDSNLITSRITIRK